MKVVLYPGDFIKVCLSEHEGSFVIEYGRNVNEIRVVSDYPDDSGREGVIYSEKIVDDEEGDEIGLVINCACGRKETFTTRYISRLQSLFGENYQPPKRCRVCVRQKNSINRRSVREADEQMD